MTMRNRVTRLERQQGRKKIHSEVRVIVLEPGEPLPPDADDPSVFIVHLVEPAGPCPLGPEDYETN